LSATRASDTIPPAAPAHVRVASPVNLREDPHREAKTEPDAELVERARDGDSAAYETLVRRHVRAAFAVALSACGSMDDAEDACQDALFRCWDRLAECREPERFRAWLMAAARNAAHNRREREALREGEPLDGVAGVAPDSPLEDLQRSLLRERLLGALALIPERERTVVLLHDLEGWLHREIGEALEISEAMSRRLLSDARAKLRRILEGPEEAEKTRDG
jgi:RNA polymerase sigma-70 factor (ECF subfamily)